MSTRLALLILSSSMFCSIALAQISWQKYPGNPVLPAWTGNINDPSAYKYTYAPSVLYDSTAKLYRMWFTSLAYGYGTSFCISYAISEDGKNWHVLSRNPVFSIGNPGSFEESAIAWIHVIQAGGEYKMYYTGSNQASLHKIGLATSTDGISWQRYAGNPIVVPGPGSWDASGADVPRVYFNGTSYAMLYQGFDGTVSAIGLATSADGIHWTKHPSNPVLTKGSPGSWDQQSVNISALAVRNGTYYLLYAGGAFTPIGFATSVNMISWQKYSGNPVFYPGTSGSWDGRIEYGSMMVKDDRLHFWYSGYPYPTSGSGWQIGYAVSDFVPVSIEGAQGNIPRENKLEQSYPNPFNPEAAIEYSIARREKVVLTVYDALGREVAVLVNEEQGPGKYTVSWKPQVIASGVYWYRMQAGDFSIGRKMVMVK